MQQFGYFNFILVVLISHVIESPLISQPRFQTRTNPEARALWFTRYEYNSEAVIRQTIQKAKEAKINMILFQVRGQADAYYFSSYEPWTERFGGNYPGFDPLAVAIDAAHRNGIELHAWLNVFPTWSGAARPISPDHIYNTHPEWIMVNSSNVPMNPAASGYAFGSPGIPAYTEHLFNVCMEVVTKYDIDGLHLDYIRYPGNNYSYDTISVARFKQETGLSSPFADQSRWAQWRRDQVSNFVYRVYDGVMARKPGIKVSAAVWGDYYDGFTDKLQDPRAWLKNAKIDFTAPMIYDADMGTYQSRLNNHARNAWGRHVYGGIGANALSSYTFKVDEILQQIEINRQLLSNGNVIFSATSLKSNLIQALNNGPYRSESPTPTMNWKTIPLITHTPLKDTEAMINPYPVIAMIQSAAPLATDSLLLIWSLSEKFETSYRATFVAISNNAYQANLPPQNDKTIFYYLIAKNKDGYISRLPQWAPISTFSFHAGPDRKKPVIAHQQEIFNSFYPVDSLKFNVTMTDNLGLDSNSVFIHYSVTNGARDSVLLFATHITDRFSGQIFPNASIQDTISYYFSAQDRSLKKNRAESNVYSIPIGIEDFESGAVGWTNEPGWQVSTEESRGGIYAIKFNPSVVFPANSISSFQTRESLNFEKSVSATLHFWTKFSLDENLLVGYVDVSSDNGAQWSPIGPALAGYTASWTEYYFSLSEYCGRGKPGILLRFRAQSLLDPGQEQIEWFIDDIAITREPTAVTSRDRIQTMPNTFTLYQNFPNPFNSTTAIQYEIKAARPMLVEMTVLNLKGQKVARLLSKRQNPGKYFIGWNGKDDSGQPVPSGVYFYQFRSSESRVVRKMTIIR